MKKQFTKSDYMLYLKCPKELWLKTNEPVLFKKEDSPEDEFLREQGYLVQSYAVQLLSKKYVGKIKEELKAEYKNLYARADIIVEDGNYTDIYEVKSSASAKDEYVDDLTFQKYVFNKSGKQIRNTFLVYINTEYVRKGKIEPEKLFHVLNMTERVNDAYKTIEKNITKAQKFIYGERPKISYVSECDDKLDCPFIKHYFTDLPEYTVYNISRINKKKRNELLEAGIIDINDVPDDFQLSKIQSYQVQVAKNESVIIKAKQIKNLLRKLEYPLYFIDYESFSYAIPLYDNFRAYRQIVFQYSLHIIDKPGAKVRHKAFLSDGKQDPQLDLLKSLKKDIKNPDGTFIVWNKTFEMTRNKEMGEMYPEFKDLMTKFNDNIFDLMTIFSTNLYVHHEFKGRTSLKKVLPVFFKKLSYKDLNINHGQLASISWYKMIKNNLPEPEKKQIEKDLLDYCCLDTYGMVKMYEVLESVN